MSGFFQCTSSLEVGLDTFADIIGIGNLVLGAILHLREFGTTFGTSSEVIFRMDRPYCSIFVMIGLFYFRAEE
jgi:hypothetical protein